MNLQQIRLQAVDTRFVSVGLPIATKDDADAFGTWMPDTQPVTSQEPKHLALQRHQQVASANADGHIGTLCCWALLNLSTFDSAQVRSNNATSAAACC
jgi:hypothetical protein